MDAAAYLARIGDPSVASPPDAPTLARLQRAHLLRVPFENLDVHLGRPIRMDVGAFHRKVVEEGRGGFCYELNGLFGALLEAVGYRVTRVSARVWGDDGAPGREFGHLALLVHLDEDWLADVGFGDFSLEPLRLREGEQDAGGEGFRLVREGEGWRAERRVDGRWAPQYSFEARGRDLVEFEEACRWTQTSPESIFTRKRVCTLATPRGRVTLRDGRLVETTDGARAERPVAPEEADALLRTLFGMPPDTRWPRP